MRWSLKFILSFLRFDLWSNPCNGQTRIILPKKRLYLPYSSFGPFYKKRMLKLLQINTHQIDRAKCIVETCIIWDILSSYTLFYVLRSSVSLSLSFTPNIILMKVERCKLYIFHGLWFLISFLLRNNALLSEKDLMNQIT